MIARKRAAPTFLNLLAIRFPIGAIASIGHRVSGVLLVIVLPLMARTLEQSLQSESDYEALRTVAQTPLTALLSAVGTWAVVHHLVAGLRHLLMDIGVGYRLVHARRSAWFAVGAGIAAGAYVGSRWLW